MALVGRALSFTFVKGGGGSFPDGSNTFNLPEGLMASVRILQAGLPGMANAVISIFGIPLDVMSLVSTLGIIVTLQSRNQVIVKAGDVGGGNTGVCFKGCILDAMIDLNQQPESPLVINALASLDIATLPAQPSSYVGASDISVILASLCNQANYKFENNGITGINLSNSYLWGSPRDQIAQVMKAVRSRGVQGAFIEKDNIFAIWPTTGARGGVYPVIKPGTTGETGTLIGYPTYTHFGIDFRCIYNPNIQFGGQVQVQSSLPSATGLWKVYGLSHSLDAQVPNGRWETIVQANRQGYPTPIVAATPATG